MADVNFCILIGRLTRDAELKYVSSGQPVCKFDIAVNKRKKQGEQWVEEAHFFSVVLWGRQGETLNQYLIKGKQVAVEGELHQNRWEQDGQTRSKIEINANNVQLLGGQGGQQSAGNPTDDPAHIQTQAKPPYSQRPATGEQDETPPDFPDDIPF